MRSREEKSEKILENRITLRWWRGGNYVTRWYGMAVGLKRGNKSLKGNCAQILESQFNPLVPDTHYSERQDKPFSLQI